MFSNLSKYMALLFLYGAGFIFAGVIAYQMIIGTNPNTLAVGLVNIIIGYVINSVGVQHGVAVTNDTVAKTAIAQFPLTIEGQDAATHKAAADTQSTAAPSVHSGH